MKKALLLSVLTLSLAFSALAQSPGYMGRRLFLKPEFSSIVAFSNPTANNKGGKDSRTGERKFGLNTRYGVQAGYVLSRRLAVVAEGSYTKTGMSLEAYTPSLVSSNGMTDVHNLFYNLGGPELGVGIQSYYTKKGSLAPLGPFWAVRARASFLTGEIFEHEIEYAEGDGSSGHAPLGIDPQYTNWAVGVELGSHYIVEDHILLSISCELNLGLGTSIPHSVSPNQSLFLDSASRRMSAHSLFFFKIGAGYIF